MDQSNATNYCSSWDISWYDHTHYVIMTCPGSYQLLQSHVYYLMKTLNQNLFFLILETSLDSLVFVLFSSWLQYDNRGFHLEILLPESICDVHYNLDLLEQQYYLSWEPLFSLGYYPGVILTFYRISFWSAYSVSSQGSLKLYRSLLGK